MGEMDRAIFREKYVVQLWILDKKFYDDLMSAVQEQRKGKDVGFEAKKGVLLRDYTPNALPTIPRGTMVKVSGIHDEDTYVVSYTAASILPGGDLDEAYTAFIPKEYISIVSYKAQL